MLLLVQQAHLKDKVCGAGFAKRLVQQPVYVPRSDAKRGAGNCNESRNCFSAGHLGLRVLSAIQLKSYLQMPNLQRECPEGLNTQAAQLSWITERTTEEPSDWGAFILSQLTNYDINSNYQQVKAAIEALEAFRRKHQSSSSRSRQHQQAKSAAGQIGSYFLFLFMLNVNVFTPSWQGHWFDFMFSCKLQLACRLLQCMQHHIL